MDVILLERIEKLGQMGDVVRVKPGYARNYLLPQKKALRATKNNLESFETRRVQLEGENLERRDEAAAIAAKMENVVVVLIRQAGESGQLYGSVTARDIAAAVTEKGFSIDRTQVLREQPIKELGLHTARVALHPEVSVTVTAIVAQSEEEAETQLNRAEAADDAVPAAADDAGENADPDGEPVDGDAAAEEPESDSATGESLDDAEETPEKS
jgi:large subunit ribosomal protein L9